MKTRKTTFISFVSKSCNYLLILPYHKSSYILIETAVPILIGETREMKWLPNECLRYKDCIILRFIVLPKMTNQIKLCH